MSQLVLASASRFRASLLENAGLAFEQVVSGVDEDEVKIALKLDGAGGGDIAETLSEMKARQVSARWPGALVIGADQVLECDGRMFDKPVDLDEARSHIRFFSGKTHYLQTAAVIVRDGQRIWHELVAVEMKMRHLDDAEINAYIQRIGDEALETVGAYNFEGVGANLFETIRGDFFTVLGLPLLPLLAFLREHGVSGIGQP